MSIYWMVLAMMHSLSPSANAMASHGELALATANAVESEDPVFGDEDRIRTAAIVVAVQFRESSFRASAIGDQGRSVCAMQILGGSRALLDDPEACVRVGIRMLRESARADRVNPIAVYARGSRHRSPEAIRISVDRMRIANQLVAAAGIRTR